MSDRLARRRSSLLWYACGLAAVVVSWVALSLRPVRSWVNDGVITPQPRFVPGAVDGLVAVVNGVRWASPFVAVAGVIFFATFALVGHSSERAAMVGRLSRIEFAGIDHLTSETAKGWRVIRQVKQFLKGTGLAVLAIVLVGATSGIEHEVTNGPLRPVDELTDLVGGGSVSYVFQSPAITFMDDSSIPQEQMQKLVDQAPVSVVPFGKHLFNLNDKSALELSVPDTVYQRISGSAESSSCTDRTIMVDDTVGAKIGSTVRLNDVPLRVVRVESGIAQMNRSIAVVSDSTVRECIQAGSSTAHFGAVIATEDTRAVEEWLTQSGVSGSAVTENEFRELNRDFWRANATPLILQLILYIALFSGFAAAGERQSALQRNSREIGMLHAIGVDFAALQAIERRRALRTTLKASVLAAPLMVPVTAAFNASELGVRIGTGATELSVGFSLTLVAMLLASHRSLTQFRKSLDLPLAVKG